MLCLAGTFSYVSTVSLAPLLTSTLSHWHLPLCETHTHECMKTLTQLQTGKTSMNPDTELQAMTKTKVQPQPAAPAHQNSSMTTPKLWKQMAAGSATSFLSAQHGPNSNFIACSDNHTCCRQRDTFISSCASLKSSQFVDCFHTATLKSTPVWGHHSSLHLFHANRHSHNFVWFNRITLCICTNFNNKSFNCIVSLGSHNWPCKSQLPFWMWKHVDKSKWKHSIHGSLLRSGPRWHPFKLKAVFLFNTLSLDTMLPLAWCKEMKMSVSLAVTEAFLFSHWTHHASCRCFDKASLAQSWGQCAPAFVLTALFSSVQFNAIFTVPSKTEIVSVNTFGDPTTMWAARTWSKFGCHASLILKKSKSCIWQIVQLWNLQKKNIKHFHNHPICENMRQNVSWGQLSTQCSIELITNLLGCGACHSTPPDGTIANVLFFVEFFLQCVCQAPSVRTCCTVGLGKCHSGIGVAEFVALVEAVCVRLVFEVWELHRFGQISEFLGRVRSSAFRSLGPPNEE